MLFATFKHHQSDFPLRGNNKFACARLALKDSPPFYRPSQANFLFRPTFTPTLNILCYSNVLRQLNSTEFGV